MTSRKAWVLIAACLLGCAGCLQTHAQADRAGKSPHVAKAKIKHPSASNAVPAAAETANFAREPALPFVPHPGNTGNVYLDRFAALWNDIHNPAHGYFSPDGVPYHSVETLIVEAPDQGHETTSEAYSYWIWLEAAYGRLTHDWRPLTHAWKSMETYIIPSQEDQPTAGSYNDKHPGVFAPEQDQPSQYPSPMINEATPGWDPLYKELRDTYGDAYVYGMHWILDVDNFYGYGRRGDGVSRPSYMNTFQRGMEESVWETVPQPSWDDFHWGASNGYLDLFVKQEGGYAPQWKYTDAPDADARAVAALYWAKTWADAAGGSKDVDALVPKAAKMGDYLRYALFDKYFKTMGCTTPTCAPAHDYQSAHYLISWYYAWGGSLSLSGGWAWRIGSSTSHQGYQNPLTAYVLSEVDGFKPASKNGARDWKVSLGRQLEVIRWLQSAQGAIAGGVSNSWRGRYAQPPAGTATFYKMAYDEKPVWVDPPSNQWFGFQAWGMERTASYFWLTNDAKAKTILDRWVPWVLKNVHFTKDSFELPSTLAWQGQPDRNWDEKNQDWKSVGGFNRTLRASVKDWAIDVGVASTTARTLLYYAAKTGLTEPARVAQRILDISWRKYRTDRGISNPEVRNDYKRFNEPVYVPRGWQGKMPSGDAIDSTSTFLSLRSPYKSDPNWPKVQSYLNGGPAPEFTYHRFWAQADIALSNATFAWLYPNGIAGTRPKPRPKATRKGKL